MNNKHTVVDVIEHEGRVQAAVSYSKVHAVRTNPFTEYPRATEAAPTLGPRPDDNTLGTIWEPWGDRPGRDDLPVRIRNKVYQVAIAGHHSSNRSNSNSLNCWASSCASFFHRRSKRCISDRTLQLMTKC